MDSDPQFGKEGNIPVNLAPGVQTYLSTYDDNVETNRGLISCRSSEREMMFEHKTKPEKHKGNKVVPFVTVPITEE